MTTDVKKMIVKVPVVSSRTGKISQREMTLTQAQDYEQSLVRKEKSADELQNAVDCTHGLPDLIVVYRRNVYALPVLLDSELIEVEKLLGKLLRSTDFPVANKKQSRNAKSAVKVNSDSSTVVVDDYR